MWFANHAGIFPTEDGKSCVLSCDSESLFR
nr:MAG TPA_asm: hypothetical protein [Caudoviricetes sp.]